ncbi:MAG: hypothetical protein Q9210_001121 [Variospora velana]
MNKPPATPTRSKSGSSSKAKTSVTQAGLILDTYRIYKDRDKPMIGHLKELVDTLQQDRGTEITPKSKFIQENSKADSQKVSKPTDANEDLAQALEKAMEAQGTPPKPKPDISFGYSDDAFDTVQKLTLYKGPRILPTTIPLPTPPASRKQAPKTPVQASPAYKRRRLVGGAPESDEEGELAK